MSNTVKRFRDYGLSSGLLAAGPKNLISDVTGVTVGHYTLENGENIRTGITVIDPGVPNLFRAKLPAAIAVGNGYGKLVGLSQIEELGTLETVIALTNTLAVGPVMRGVVDLTLANTPDILPYETINAVVGETNDGLVNSIHDLALSSDDVAIAYAARTADFELGCVGAGTGTRAFSWKGGIGSASRKVGKYTVGALVQTNFGGALTVMGVPVGVALNSTDFDIFRPKPDGSCMIVIATDAPFDALQLKRLAKRALLGMVRTGSIMADGSGDYAIAFSTSRAPAKLVGNDLNPFFLAAAEATEESIYDALFAAKTTTGRNGNVLKKLPVDDVVAIVKEQTNASPK